MKEELGRRRRRREANNEVNVGTIGLESMDWVHLAQNSFDGGLL